MIAETATSFLSFIGLYALICYLYDNLRSPLLLFYSNYKNKNTKQGPNTLIERYGKWAAITGSTDGIGKGYARALARRGLNILLISRNESKLNAVRAEIESEFGVQVKIIVADFCKGPEIYDHIEKELGELPIGILVNNVGITTSRPGPMFHFSAQELWDVIYTNIGAVTIMSRLFIRRMRQSNIKGIIINISSGSELQPLPYAATYAASKAYNRSLTLALQREAEPLGIEVQLVSPWFVVTNINKWSKYVMRGGLAIPDYNTYAETAVNTIGKTDETTGYFWHAIQTAIVKLLSARTRAAVVFASTKWMSKIEKSFKLKDDQPHKNIKN